MSPLPVPPHAHSVLATATTATGIEKSGEPAPAGAWPIRRYIIWRNNYAYDERLRQVVARANVA
jgi:hypothetical protein